jgi:hypothetical protein
VKRDILNNEKKENIIVYTFNLLSMENVAISKSVLFWFNINFDQIVWSLKFDKKMFSELCTLYKC